MARRILEGIGEGHAVKNPWSISEELLAHRCGKLTRGCEGWQPFFWTKDVTATVHKSTKAMTKGETTVLGNATSGNQISSTTVPEVILVP